LFLEAAGAFLKICLSLKPNQHSKFNQIKIVQICEKLYGRKFDLNEKEKLLAE